MNNVVRLACVVIALVKLDEIFSKCDPDTYYERVCALRDASLDVISEDCPYLDWVNQVRSYLPFCNLDLIEEQTVYRWYLDVINMDNVLPF